MLKENDKVVLNWDVINETHKIYKTPINIIEDVKAMDNGGNGIHEITCVEHDRDLEMSFYILNYSGYCFEEDGLILIERNN